MKKKRIMALFLSAALLLCGLPMASAATQPYVESDTTADFTKSQGDYYWFKFTVHGTHADPQIVAGNGNVLKTGNCKKLKNANGEDEYRFQVWAIGKPGEASAIYTTLPGQSPVRHCAITISDKQTTPTGFTASQAPSIPQKFETLDPISRLENSLNKEYGTLNTNFGTYNLNIEIFENDSKYEPCDYEIYASLPLFDMDGVDESLRYTDDEKATYFKAFKDQMAKIALAAEKALPGKKISGGYQKSYYTYPNLQVDLNLFELYMFKNYSTSNTDDLYPSYDETFVDCLRWCTDLDYMEVPYKGAENISGEQIK